MSDKQTYNDLEQIYKNKGYEIIITHIASGKEVRFKGLITDYSDNFNSNWKEDDVYGRQDPISIFQNTKRTIALAWDVVAAYIEEAQENMSKMSLLINMLYPVYDGEGATSITTSPLIKIKFANLIQNVDTQDIGGGLVGKVNGFSFSPVLEEQFFDPAYGLLYPKSLKVNCNFTVIHTHELGWNAKKEQRNTLYPYGVSYKQVENPREKKSTTSDAMREQKKSQQDKMLGVKK